MPDPTARLEKIPTVVLESHEALSRAIARRIAEVIRERDAAGAARGAGPRHRLHADRRLPRADPDAPRGGARASARVVTFNLDEYYPMDAGEPPLLPPLHAGEPLRSRRHRPGRRPHPARRRCRATRSRADVPRRTRRPSARPAASTSSSSASGRPATSASTSPARAPRAARALDHARRDHPARRRRRFLRRGERARARRSPWASRTILEAREIAHPRHRRAQGGHRAPRRRGRGGPRGRRHLPAAAPATPRSTSTAPPPPSSRGSRRPGWWAR